MTQQRCKWCNPNNPEYVKYHDTEWGVFSADDTHLFELLLLEIFQAGLSWETVLNKRSAFKKAFDGFDPKMILKYDEEKLNELMNNSSLIRNRKKIEAVINNASIFLEISNEWGGFASYLRSFTDGKLIYEWDKSFSPLSDAVCADLKRRGMRFIGSTVIYSYLQSAGMIFSHSPDCFLYREEDCSDRNQSGALN